MGIVVALLFLVIGVLSLVLYAGTPHGTGGTVCGPINFLGYTFNIGADCQYVSVGELVIGAFLFIVAIFAAIGARPRRPPQRPQS